MRQSRLRSTPNFPGRAAPGILATSQLVLAARVIAAVAQAGLLALLARSTSLGEFGMLTTIFATCTAVMAFTDLGQTSLAQRTIAREGLTHATRQLTAGHDYLQWSGGAAIAAVMLAYSIATHNGLYLGLFGLWYALEKISDSRAAMMLGLDRPFSQAQNLIIRRFSALGVFALLLAVDVQAGPSYVAAITVAAALGVAHIALATPQEVVPHRPRRSDLATARHFTLASVSVGIRNLEPLVVTQAVGTVLAAPYVAIVRLASPLQMLASSVSAALLPGAARVRGASRELTRAVAWSMVAHLVLYGGIAALAPQFLGLALGNEYAGAATLFRLYLVGLWFAAGTAMLTAVLQGAGHERISSRISLIATVTGLSAVAVAARLRGPDAAAAAMSATYAVQFIILSVSYWRVRT